MVWIICTKPLYWIDIVWFYATQKVKGKDPNLARQITYVNWTLLTGYLKLIDTYKYK